MNSLNSDERLQGGHNVNVQFARRLDADSFTWQRKRSVAATWSRFNNSQLVYLSGRDSTVGVTSDSGSTTAANVGTTADTVSATSKLLSAANVAFQSLPFEWTCSSYDYFSKKRIFLGGNRLLPVTSATKGSTVTASVAETGGAAARKNNYWDPVVLALTPFGSNSMVPKDTVASSSTKTNAMTTDTTCKSYFRAPLELVQKNDNHL